MQFVCNKLQEIYQKRKKKEPVLHNVLDKSFILYNKSFCESYFIQLRVIIKLTLSMICVNTCKPENVFIFLIRNDLL